MRGEMSEVRGRGLERLAGRRWKVREEAERRHPPAHGRHSPEASSAEIGFLAALLRIAPPTFGARGAFAPGAAARWPETWPATMVAVWLPLIGCPPIETGAP